MLKNLKLNVQMAVAFASIMALLVIISTVAWFGLNSSYNGFVDYRGLARDTNLSARVQADMLKVRLSVLKFLNERSEESLQDYNDLQAELDQLLVEAKVKINQPERAALIEEVVAEVEEYKSGFTKVVALIRKTEEMVATKLDPAGLSMHKQMTDIMQAAYADDDTKAAFYAAQVQENLLLGRLYVTKYLITNTKEDHDRAMKALSETLPPLFMRLD
ncbi:MAG: MCP four helix bundle domain-containing protein [Motiliproteus sp.]